MVKRAAIHSRCAVHSEVSNAIREQLHRWKVLSEGRLPRAWLSRPHFRRMPPLRPKRDDDQPPSIISHHAVLYMYHVAWWELHKAMSADTQGGHFIIIDASELEHDVYETESTDSEPTATMDHEQSMRLINASKNGTMPEYWKFPDANSNHPCLKGMILSMPIL